MTDLIGWFSITVNLIAVPSTAMISILFHRQRKSRGSLLLASGLTTIFIGMIIGFIIPQTFETIEEAERVIITVGPPLQWFIDDIVYSIGKILTLIGFGLVVIEDKNNV